MRALRIWVVAALALAGTGLFALVQPTSAAAASYCSSSGTIIAVDYAHWDGPVVRGCDTRKPKNGAYLLTQEGFTLAGTAHDGPAFVCRIGNQAFDSGTQYPTPATEGCVVTPPASAYWSYWLAPAGQDTWSYSQLGAYSQVPRAGEVDLWIYGATNTSGTEGRPTCSPASLRAGGSTGHCSPVGPAGPTTSHRPKPKPTSRSTATSKPKPGTTAAGHEGGAPGGRTSSTPAPGRHSSSQPGGAALSSAKALASAQAREQSAAAQAAAASRRATSGPSGAPPTAGEIVAARPAAHVRSSSGSIVPLITGIGLAAVLALGGGFAVWRRQQPGQ